MAGHSNERAVDVDENGTCDHLVWKPFDVGESTLPRWEYKELLESPHNELKTNVSLVAAGPRGYIFVGCKEGLCVYRAANDLAREISIVEDGEIGLGYAVHALGISPTGLKLYVLSHSKLYFYNVSSLVKSAVSREAYAFCDVSFAVRQTAWVTDTTLVAISINGDAYRIRANDGSAEKIKEGVYSADFNPAINKGAFGMMDGSIQIVGSNLESQQEKIENDGEGKCFFVKVLEDQCLAAVHRSIDSDSEYEDSQDEDSQDEDCEDDESFQLRIFDLNSRTWSTSIIDHANLSDPKKADSDEDEETEGDSASIPRSSEIKFFGLYIPHPYRTILLSSNRSYKFALIGLNDLQPQLWTLTATENERKQEFYPSYLLGMALSFNFQYKSWLSRDSDDKEMYPSGPTPLLLTTKGKLHCLTLVNYNMGYMEEEGPPPPPTFMKPLDDLPEESTFEDDPMNNDKGNSEGSSAEISEANKDDLLPYPPQKEQMGGTLTYPSPSAFRAVRNPTKSSIQMDNDPYRPISKEKEDSPTQQKTHMPPAFVKVCDFMNDALASLDRQTDKATEKAMRDENSSLVQNLEHVMRINEEVKTKLKAVDDLCNRVDDVHCQLEQLNVSARHLKEVYFSRIGTRQREYPLGTITRDRRAKRREIIQNIVDRSADMYQFVEELGANMCSPIVSATEQQKKLYNTVKRISENHLPYLNGRVKALAQACESRNYVASRKTSHEGRREILKDEVDVRRQMYGRKSTRTRRRDFVGHLLDFATPDQHLRNIDLEAETKSTMASHEAEANDAKAKYARTVAQKADKFQLLRNFMFPSPLQQKSQRARTSPTPSKPPGLGLNELEGTPSGQSSATHSWSSTPNIGRGSELFSKSSAASNIAVQGESARAANSRRDSLNAKTVTNDTKKNARFFPGANVVKTTEKVHVHGEKQNPSFFQSTRLLALTRNSTKEMSSRTSNDLNANSKGRGVPNAILTPQSSDTRPKINGIPQETGVFRHDNFVGSAAPSSAAVPKTPLFGGDGGGRSGEIGRFSTDSPNSPYISKPENATSRNMATPAAIPAFTTAAAPSSSGAENVRQEVMKIYQQYNPSEMQKAEAALLKYAGKEQVLLDKLRKKYVNRANSQSQQNGFGGQQHMHGGQQQHQTFTTSGVAQAPKGFIVQQQPPPANAALSNRQNSTFGFQQQGATTTPFVAKQSPPGGGGGFGGFANATGGGGMQQQGTNNAFSAPQNAFGGQPSTINPFGQQPAQFGGLQQGAQHTFAAQQSAQQRTNSGLAGAHGGGFGLPQAGAGAKPFFRI